MGQELVEGIGRCLFVTTLVMMLMALTFAVHTHAAQGGFVSVNQSPVDWAINTLSERVTHLEGQNLESRVSVVEHGMDEIRYWTRGIAMAVLGQLVYMAFGRKAAR